jgi:hypothetical protein
VRRTSRRPKPASTGVFGAPTQDLWSVCGA